MKKNDGLNISEQFLLENAKKLKGIPDTPVKGRVIPLRLGFTFGAVAAALAAVLVFRLQPSENTDLFADVTSEEVYQYYDSGLIDVETDLLMEYTSVDDFTVEIDPNEEELDLLLDDLNDEELYNILN
ncbi:hypothetical protein [Phaeocystidibacter luteus]|uniref:Uncharacterized protein n=1 Tax=Phaeocystidibacter luteus TaxID=911197 RepID=A0A6N6RMR0_9FLAO|nr:hypothetical protein [Phaeocystidibacter luteus]KAB2814859.1 hypothetical protein F8C67_03670 [Phaeocystidibacter luteus]